MTTSSNHSRRPALVGIATLLVALTLGATVEAGSRTWTTDADFAAGVAVNLNAVGDAIGVDTAGVGEPDPSIAWWDALWGQRQCIDVTNNEASALTEFQIAIQVDTAAPIAGLRMNADGDDVRFIASDGSTELDYWIEGPIDDAATSISVQTDTLPPGSSTICMYYDNAAAAPMSDIYAPFTYTTAQDLYVAVSETQVNQAIAVTSYVAGNTISDGISSVTLGVGGTHTFPAAGHTAATVVSATGPIAIQGTGDRGDSFVPVAFAGTDFLIPTERGSNRVSLFAPFASATVTVEHSGTTSPPTTVAAGTSLTLAADITSSVDSIVITSDQPVLVTHIAGNDALIAPPATSEPLYGIRSTANRTGFGADGTTVSIRESNGNTIPIGGNAGGANVRTGGGVRGTGPAVIATITAGGPIAAIQQADADGSESTSYWPTSELNVVYRTPVTIDYIAFACPVQGTANIDADGATLNCTGSGGAGFPGKALDAGGGAAGSLYQSLDGIPFYAYAEDDAYDDENNILGPKQARLATTNAPTATVGPEQSRFETDAAWTSAAHDTGCSAFFDDLSWNPTSQPPDATVGFQVATAASATGPFAFLGPDGTAATSYTAATGSAIAAVHDGDQFVQVRAALTSASDQLNAPSITDVTVSWTGATTVTGTLFSDVDGDGTNDPADPGLTGIDVTLWLDDGNGVFDSGADTAVATVASGGGGAWLFTDQPAGTYFVEADEAQLPAGHSTPATTSNPFGPIVAGECTTSDVAIGWQPVGTITTTVFSDLDGNGVLDGADVGVAGIDVGIWLDDGNGIFDPFADERVSVVTTGPAGDVSAPGLPLGDYFVFVASGDEPAGHSIPATTLNPAGPFTVGVGDDVGAEIGFRPAGAIAGTAFADTNGDDVQQSGEDGVNPLVVDVYLDNGDGIFDPASDTVAATVRTSTTGAYIASGLAPGDYWVVPFDPPAPLIPVAPIAATVSGTDSTVIDIAFQLAESISGVVVYDEDGTVDSGSVPIAGMPLTLHLDNGDGLFDPATDTQVAVGLTDAAGNFSFANVAPGNYFVQLRPSPLLGDQGPRLVGANPLGPVAPGTGGLVFAFDPTTVTLPETGATAAHDAMRIGAVMLLIGLVLLGAGRRRRSTI